MKYMNRSAHLLSRGTPLADAAILYHAQAECGGSCMYFQKPGRQLMERQLDYDVIPVDALEKAIVANRNLCALAGGCPGRTARGAVLRKRLFCAQGRSFPT